MDKDRVKGAGKQAKGSVKEGLGKATGDSSLEAQGKMDKTSGKVQKEFGKAKDSARKS